MATYNTKTLIQAIEHNLSDLPGQAFSNEPIERIRVLDAANGKFVATETRPQDKPKVITEGMVPYPRKKARQGHAYGRRTVSPEVMDMAESQRPINLADFRESEEFPGLREASSTGRLSTSNFPDLLRMGIQFDLFSSYNEFPVTYPQWTRSVDSDDSQEEYPKDAALGRLARVAEGSEYPEIPLQINDGVIIRNYKSGGIIKITEEMMRFDETGKVREISELMGRSARLTEELDSLDVLTTTGNYTRSNTNGDNDEAATGSGANTQTLTFSPAALVTAWNILTTMKDRKTGVKLGVRPNLMVVAPKLAWYVKALIGSPTMLRIGATSTNDVYGQGTENQFFQLVPNIIVNPYFGGGYEWSLMEAPRAITFQRVDPVQVLQEGLTAASFGYFNADELRYRVRDWYGVGMRDDRFAFFSNSTTAPIAN